MIDADIIKWCYLNYYKLICCYPLRIPIIIQLDDIEVYSTMTIRITNLLTIEEPKLTEMA